MINKIKMTRASSSFVIVGAGYVGLSLGVLLSRQFKVGIIDLNKDIKDNKGESYLDEDLLQLDLKNIKKIFMLQQTIMI